MKTIGLISLVFLINIALSQAQEPQWDWVEGLYTPDEERATAVASDPNTAEVYLAGEWRGTLAGFFPAGPTESTDFAATYGGVDGIVVKLDPAGNVMWAFKVGGEGDDRINDIHVDHQNNFYITGSMGAGTAVFSGTSSVTADSLFFNPSPAMCYLAKYDPLGRLLWFRWAANDNLAHGKAITSNSSAVFLTGHHQGTIQFGPHPPYASVGGDDIFIVKYTMDGAEEWHVAAGSDKDDFGEGIACDETHLYVAGSFNGAVLDYKDMSGGMITATINTADGQADVFVASSTTDGFHEWTRIIASALDDDCRGVALDSDHIYLAGTIGQEAIFPLYAANPVPYKGGEDAYVCALSRADGATRWVSTLTGDADGDQVVRDLSMDMSGGLYVTGFFTTNVTTTDVINDSKGVEDVFLAAYNRSGDEKWIKTAGSEGIDMGNGVCASTPGTVYLAGEYDDFTAFDSDLLPADGNQNMFVASLNLDCVDAIGGILSAPETVIPEGEAITLVLKNYLGDIRWEFSLPGMNNWALLTADLSDSIQVFPSGTGDYRAFVTSGDCAPDSSNVIRIEVVNANIRFADAGEDVKICPGDSIQLKASGGDFYKWDPVDGLEPPDVPDPWAKPLITTSYVVHVTNADGLTDTDTMIVFVLPRPKVNAGADIEACQGEQVELSAQGDGELFWFQLDRVDESAIIGPVVSPDTTTTFVVVIVDISGCRGFDQVTVFITKPPMVNAGMNRVLIEQFEFRMEATLEPGESGTWHLESGSGTFDDPHAPDTRVTGLEFGDNIFSWTVTNEICPEAIGRVGIRVKERQIPTVITPNGDGKNDHFLVAGILRFPGSELVVLNRWGEEVYRASPYENNWDGVNHEGRELPEGTYYIILKLTEDDIRKRSVMIIR